MTCGLELDAGRSETGTASQSEILAETIKYSNDIGFTELQIRGGI